MTLAHPMGGGGGSQESATPQLPVNIVMAIEGEEENDSKGFIPAIVRIERVSCVSCVSCSTHRVRCAVRRATAGE
jgi:hypothetical protein